MKIRVELFVSSINLRSQPNQQALLFQPAEIEEFGKTRKREIGSGLTARLESGFDLRIRHAQPGKQAASLRLSALNCSRFDHLSQQSRNFRVSQNQALELIQRPSCFFSGML